MNGFCKVCGTKTNSVCEGCKNAFYCSKECQNVDWKEAHKTICSIESRIQNPSNAKDYQFDIVKTNRYRASTNSSKGLYSSGDRRLKDFFTLENKDILDKVEIDFQLSLKTLERLSNLKVHKRYRSLYDSLDESEKKIYMFGTEFVDDEDEEIATDVFKFGKFDVIILSKDSSSKFSPQSKKEWEKSLIESFRDHLIPHYAKNRNTITKGGVFEFIFQGSGRLRDRFLYLDLFTILNKMGLLTDLCEDLDETDEGIGFGDVDKYRCHRYFKNIFLEVEKYIENVQDGYSFYPNPYYYCSKFNSIDLFERFLPEFYFFDILNSSYSLPKDNGIEILGPVFNPILNKVVILCYLSIILYCYYDTSSLIDNKLTPVIVYSNFIGENYLINYNDEELTKKQIQDNAHIKLSQLFDNILDQSLETMEIKWNKNFDPSNIIGDEDEIDFIMNVNKCIELTNYFQKKIKDIKAFKKGSSSLFDNIVNLAIMAEKSENNQLKGKTDDPQSIEKRNQAYVEHVYKSYTNRPHFIDDIIFKNLNLEFTNGDGEFVRDVSLLEDLDDSDDDCDFEICEQINEIFDFSDKSLSERILSEKNLIESEGKKAIKNNMNGYIDYYFSPRKRRDQNDRLYIFIDGNETIFPKLKLNKNFKNKVIKSPYELYKFFKYEVDDEEADENVLSSGIYKLSKNDMMDMVYSYITHCILDSPETVNIAKEHFDNMIKLSRKSKKISPGEEFFESKKMVSNSSDRD